MTKINLFLIFRLLVSFKEGLGCFEDIFLTNSNWGHYQRNFPNFEKYQSELTNFFCEQKMFVDLTLSLF